MLGIHKSLVSYMERGERWTIENLEEIAAALGMQGWELLRMVEGGDLSALSAEEAELLGAFRSGGYFGVVTFTVPHLRPSGEPRGRKA